MLKRKGFTLIELLVAVFITSIVVLAAYSLMTGSTKSFREQDERRMLEANLRNAELLIQRDIARAGYHVPFDSESDTNPDVPALCTGGETKLNALAFQYSANSFAILADITDYDGFAISNFSNGSPSGTITINNSINLPPSASQFYTFLSTGASVMSPGKAENESFQPIFNRAFNGVHLGYIQSPTNQGILVQITSTATTTETSTINVSICNELKKHGFSEITPLVGDKIFPVSYIVYTLQGGVLRRCLMNPMQNPGAAGSANNCQVVLENVDNFKIFPISKTMGTDAANNGLNPTFADNPAVLPFSQVKISELIGVNYRISIHGTNTWDVNPPADNTPNGPYFKDDGKVVVNAYIEGASMLKTTNLSTSDKFCLNTSLSTP